MRPLIVLTFLVSGCIPLPYVGDIVNQAAQAAQEQAHEQERQAAQTAQARAQARAQAEQRARWEADQQAQAAEAARRQQEAQRYQDAVPMRWQAAPVSAQPPEASPASAAAGHRTEPPAAAFAVDQTAASPIAPLASEAQPRTDLAPRLPPLTVVADPPAVRPTSPDSDSASDNPQPRRQPTTSRPSPKLAQQRKPAPPAKRYEVIQVLMCNDGSESPTCSCGGPRRGCCSHHGGVSGCESRRIPLGPEP